MVYFGFWGLFWFIFNLGGNFGSILGFRVTLGPFWVRGSLLVHFWVSGHFWFIWGLGVTLGPFWVRGSLLAHFGPLGSESPCRYPYVTFIVWSVVMLNLAQFG